MLWIPSDRFSSVFWGWKGGEAANAVHFRLHFFTQKKLFVLLLYWVQCFKGLVGGEVAPRQSCRFYFSCVEKALRSYSFWGGGEEMPLKQSSFDFSFLGWKNVCCHEFSFSRLKGRVEAPFSPPLSPLHCGLDFTHVAEAPGFFCYAELKFFEGEDGMPPTQSLYTLFLSGREDLSFFC